MQETSLPTQAPVFRRVDSGHGLDWWRSAWRWLFHRGAAGVWIVMCLIALLIFGSLHVLGMLGAIAAHIGVFVFAGGLMLAARKTEQGTPPAIGDLFAGFQSSLGPLATGGALLVIAAALVVWGALAVVGIGAAIGALESAMSGNLALLFGLFATFALVTLVALLLLLPVCMAAWLSPALIVLRQQPPVEALKTSLAACWANLGALSVYGLLWIAAAIVATVPLFLGWLVLVPLAGPMMALSAYAMYQDLFEATTLTPGPSPTGVGEGS